MPTDDRSTSMDADSASDSLQTSVSAADTPAGTSSVDSRRSFIAKMMASGFALAVQPVMADMIHTSDAGLEAGPTSIDLPDNKTQALPAYYAKPMGASKPLPVVLVVQEIFGVHEHIQDLCRRLAKAGYFAVAPELYFRQGDPRQYTSIPELVDKVVSKVPDAQVLSDLDATAAWTTQHGGDANHMAITGFCWGGRITWLYAAHNPHLKAATAWYGPLVGQPTDNTPRFPVDIAGELKVPVLGLYGGQDPNIKQEHVAQMRDALAKVHSKSQIIVYQDAGHGFNADYRPSYNEKDAKDGWQHMLAWFKQNGVAGS
ncbi:putative dienelactone hydrolase [Pararobbsia alpina]|uniref:dienelactone hydrolase family protein n=1 Tax=Pararobbsia alpina TaxID=621374 RepID=UPI0039A6C360